ncbi:hypothetical protein EDC96DRAFT_586998 [Choanephora cucurbitarum]|nr:hypothetical protein EDC96DRAFT_586998 [Choanephora cucurbitarum]
MSPASFKALFDTLENSHVYEESERKQQTDLRFQMIVALERLSIYGNGTAWRRVARKAEISANVYVKVSKNQFSNINQRQRGLGFAIIEPMGENYLRWLTKAEKTAPKTAIEQEHGFPFYLAAFMELAIILLLKFIPWLNTMSVCDSNKRIIKCVSGYAALAHKARVYNGSDLALHPKQSSDGEEYILADSAYAATLTVVSILKSKRIGFTLRNKSTTGSMQELESHPSTVMAC